MKKILSQILFVLVVATAGLAILYCSSPKDDAGDAGAGDSAVLTCKSDSECDAAKKQKCFGGTCITPECKVNTDCKTAGKTCCNANTLTCAACGTPSDGGSDAAVDGGGGTDGGGCQLKTDCGVTQWCDAATGICSEMGTCNSDDMCAVNHVCNSFTKACECLNDDACKTWPDGKTACDPQLKKCDVPSAADCNPACDSACQDCDKSSSPPACQFKSGMECCGDNDCITAPKLYCDSATHTCFEKHTCADACSTDQDCKDWCGTGGGVYTCVGSVCTAAECQTDTDCDTPCAPNGGTCNGGACTCNQGAAGLCTDCSVNATVCTAAGLSCGYFSKKCTKKCTDDSECMDPYGQLWTCSTMVTYCDCNTPSSSIPCSPPCTPPQTCDGTTGTCI